MLALAALGAETSSGQTVGPGTITVPVLNNGATGDRTIVGNTTVAIPAAGSATSVTAGTLTLDPNAPGFPAGPITIQSTSGHGLFANSATTPAAIVALPGVTVSTSTFGTAVVAFGSAASVTASGLTISNTATGSGAGYGAIAQNGGTISLADTSVTVSRSGAIALGASGAGSSLAMQGNNAITSNGAQGVGLYAQNGGTVSLPAGTVLNLNGQGNAGVVLDAAPQAATAIGDGLTIHLTGTGQSYVNGSVGVAALAGSTATLNGLVVDGADAGTGVVAYAGDPRSTGAGNAGASSRVDLAGATITIGRAGTSTFSMASSSGTQLVTLAGNTTPALTSQNISTPAGLRAAPGSQASQAATSTINATDTTINMNAANGFGVYAGARAVSGLNTVNLANSTVNGTGAASYGLGADQNGAVNATGSTVNVSGGGGGLYLITGTDVAGGVGPAIALNSSNVTTSGSATYGIVSQNFSNTLTNRVQLTGSSVNAPEAVGIYVSGGPTSVVADNATINGGTRLLTAIGSAGAPQATVADVLARNSSVLTGDASANATATANITLQTASRWTGAALNVTNVSTDPTGTWLVTGNSTVSQQVSNAGTVAFTAPAGGAFKTLTTQNYAGNGGVLAVNTVLGADGSPSDKLVINGGTASGTSGIRVANAGGAGALTTSNGILVVDVANGGTTGPTSFSQSGRAVAGVYEYRLFRGGVDGASPQAWYLRSELPPEPPAPPVPPPPNPEVIVPLLRPEVGAYLANQRIATGFLIHSLHDRLGEPQWTEQQTFENDDAKRGSGWVRLVGKDIGSRTRNGTFDVQSTAWMLQLGGDVAQWSVFRGDDRLHLGGMAGYNWGSSTGRAAGNPFTADSDVQGVNVGVYGTWFQNDKSRLGWYTDLWAQFGWFSNHVDGQLLPSVSYHSKVLALSAEAGYAWLPAFTRDWAVEPQAQVIYVHGYQGTFSEPNGTQVGGADSGGVITRLGVRMHRTWIDGKGQRYQPYLTLNWWHDSVDNNIALNGIAMSDLYPRNRYEVKLGLDVQGRKGWTGWSNVGWQWGTQAYHAFIGRVGVKYTW
ncbi:autotransporter outer membrane beta-barrel domain-containing protein [Cupriavidus sp. 30B13]|uniref:autotransporter family protein n=1 Tax=Cupriavidus sp. 30B13 TaxID=3384241 RepID=UPI003B9085DB